MSLTPNSVKNWEKKKNQPFVSQNHYTMNDEPKWFSELFLPSFWQGDENLFACKTHQTLFVEENSNVF